MLWLLILCFQGAPGSWSGSISNCFACLWDLFSPTGLAPSVFLLILVLLYLLVPCSVDVSLSPSLFLGKMGEWIWRKGKVKKSLEE